MTKMNLLLNFAQLNSYNNLLNFKQILLILINFIILIIVICYLILFTIKFSNYQMTQISIVDQCFQQIKELAYPNQIKIKNIIQKHLTIKPKPLQPLCVTQHHSLKDIQNLQAEFYQQKFVPSPQLISNYQTTYLKSLRGQKPSSIVNSKLKQLYQTQNSNFKGEKNSAIPQSYKNLYKSYHQKTNLAQNKRVFIENKQQTILSTLKQQKGQFVLDKMEASLIQNQLSNLNKKGVVIEQTNSLLDWKQKRKNMEKQFKQYKK